MLNCICSQNKYTVHESSTAKKVGVSLALLAGAGALLTLGTLFLLHSKLEATRLAPLGRYMSQHPQAFKISGISSITLAILPTGSLAIYLYASTGSKKLDTPPSKLLSDNPPPLEDEGTLVEANDRPQNLYKTSRMLVRWDGKFHWVDVYRNQDNSKDPLYYFFRTDSEPTPPNTLGLPPEEHTGIQPAKIDQPLYSMPAQ